jgi:signal recognition particle receptor subunit alpha
MLDALALFTPSGILLYSASYTPSLPPAALTTLLNTLISKHILEARGGTTYSTSDHVLHYNLTANLICVAVVAASLASKVTYGQALCDVLSSKLSKSVPLASEDEYAAVVDKAMAAVSKDTAPVPTNRSPVKQAKPLPNNGSNNAKQAVSLNRNKISKTAAAALDHSGAAGNADNAMDEARRAFLPDDDAGASDDEDDDDEDSEAPIKSSWFGNLMGTLTGNRIITKDDVEKPLAALRSDLEGNNVASDIAASICGSVSTSLVGRNIVGYSIPTMIKSALAQAIERVLTPATPVDVLRDVISNREARTGRPYTIVFVGINGVGKSTSLAKVAYYLKSHGCKPIIAACDTFRSGAVEQLEVHAKCLEVPLFQKGYAGDPAGVAKEAIKKASSDGNDVVLIDTAGRMQNNVPLMNALSKLVVSNDVDLVLFVGEALVGNDGVDQLKMFDEALKKGGHNRTVDGIILTKFDTVSEKVGAAITMSQVCGSPVVFVGVGQKYNHLKKLSAKYVIKTLFK